MNYIIPGKSFLGLELVVSEKHFLLNNQFLNYKNEIIKKKISSNYTLYKNQSLGIDYYFNIQQDKLEEIYIYKNELNIIYEKKNSIKIGMNVIESFKINSNLFFDSFNVALFDKKMVGIGYFFDDDYDYEDLIAENIPISYIAIFKREDMIIPGVIDY